MKKHVCIVTAMLCLLLVSGLPAAMGGTENVTPNAENRISPGGVVLGGLTELGMLAFGIVWEGVRIVLPEGYSLKERDVDDLVGPHGLSSGSDDIR